MLAVIGELFEEPNVVGIGMAIRSREDLLSVWNEDNSNEKVRSIHLSSSTVLLSWHMPWRLTAHLHGMGGITAWSSLASWYHREFSRCEPYDTLRRKRAVSHALPRRILWNSATSSGWPSSMPW